MSGQRVVSEADVLKVVIIGAGIGGLSAAVFLRQQGHDVEVRSAQKVSENHLTWVVERYMNLADLQQSWVQRSISHQMLRDS
jgi:2-polyprenyl-6-methoxyphenol hydroxylase-like FAD-dependent oxidoreductase